MQQYKIKCQWKIYTEMQIQLEVTTTYVQWFVGVGLVLINPTVLILYFTSPILP